MDITEKVELIKRPPTKEIVKDEAELIELLKQQFQTKTLHWFRNFRIFASWKFNQYRFQN